jgi:hypothetical protein
MREDKFEKQVREKMDQLGFDPSDAVWLRVDQEINERKERRKPIFWIFFISGLMITAGATYLALNNFNFSKKIPVAGGIVLNRIQNISQNKGQIRYDAVPLKMSAINKSGSFQSGDKTFNKESIETHGEKIKRETEKYEYVEKKAGQQSGETMQAQAHPGVDNEHSMSRENTKAASVINEKTKKIVTADSVSGIKTVKDKTEKTRKSKWSVGYTAGAGASNVNESLFQPQNPASLSASLYYPTYNGTAIPTIINTPSESSAGFSFNFGVFLKRNLSRRISASVGLGYHYYSTGIHTGIPVNSVYTVNYSYAQAAPVNSYYQSGDGQKFTNQYHFIELPVNLSFQLNKSHKNPVNWEGGVSLAWLVSTNALHFDPYNNVYFENSQLFNKFQWDAAMSLLVGFPVYNHTIHIGPQVQYGLTGLLKNSGSNPGHLTYFGLKFSFNP